MPSLRVQIVRFIDEYQPGIVECQFQDAEGRVHAIIDKLPYFTQADLWSDSEYPQPGTAPCLILGRISAPDGRDLVHITTIETIDGKSEFVVVDSDLVP